MRCNSAVFTLLLCLMSFYTLIAQGPITQITSAPSFQRSPDIYGDRIVWEDTRNGNPDIYMYDISSGVETQITSDSSEQRYPAIWGNRIVWQDDRNGYWDIYMYELPSGPEIRITSDTSNQEYPDIWDNYIVWQDDRNVGPNQISNDDIFMYDILQGIESPVCTKPDAQRHPSIWSHLVVWEDFRNRNQTGWDIYMYNIISGKRTTICNDPNDQNNPSIFERRIVYEDNRWGNSDIYLFYLYYYLPYNSNHLEWPLTLLEIDQFLPVAANQKNPKIYGNQLVFTDDRTGNSDIYLFDFSWKVAGNVMPIAIFPDFQQFPAVFENKVVWQDHRTTITDIYLWERPPGADLSILSQDAPDPVQVGDYITYTIYAKNEGPLEATGVVVSDTLPAGLAFFSATATQGSCSAAGNIVTCNLGNIPMGEVVTVTIVAKAINNGGFFNYAGITGNEIDEYQANNSHAITTAITEDHRKVLKNGWWPQMDLDASDHVHLTYVKDGSGMIVHSGSYTYVYSEDDIVYATNESGFWEVDVIFEGFNYADPPTPPHHLKQYKGIASDISIDSEGNLHLVYIRERVESDISGMPRYGKYSLYYMKRDHGIWGQEELIEDIIYLSDYNWLNNTAGGPVGCSSLSMDTDSQGNVYFLYKHSTPGPNPGELFLVNNSSGSWETNMIHSQIYTEAELSIDTNDHHHISFYSWNINPSGPFAQGVGYLTNAPSGIWQAPEPIEPLWTGSQMEPLMTDIAIDQSNRPHVVYSSGAGNIQEDTRYALKDNNIWNTTLIDPGTWTSSYNAICLDPAEKVHLCYIHYQSQELRYATNTSGSWVIDMLDDGPWGWTSAGPQEGKHDMMAPEPNDVHIVYDRDDKIRYIHKTEALDQDSDGIPDDEEQGPQGNDPNYDGNGDGIPDSQQGNVASFHSNDGVQYVTLENPDTTTTLGDVQAVSKPAANDPGAPADEDAPYGFFKFTIYGLDVGDTTHVNFILHGGPAVSTYYKYSPTPDSTINHWYQFMYDGATGAVIHGDTITLHFIDGQRGDRDISANGIVTEPGAPGIPPTGIKTDSDILPGQFQLFQNYPNPFNPSTTIRYSIPRISEVEITIFNILGQKIRSYRIDHQSPGTYNLSWDGRNENKQSVASGMYIYRLKTAEFNSMKKMLLIR